MASELQTLEELIESRKYLLEFQKRALVEDLCLVQSDKKQIEKITDTIFYKLFGVGWDSLTGLEQQDIYDAWKGD